MCRDQLLFSYKEERKEKKGRRKAGGKEGKPLVVEGS